MNDAATNPIALRPPARSDVCAVLVTYHPDAGFTSRLHRVLPQVGGAVVVDNGSSPEAVSMLRGLAAEPTVAVVYNAENIGIAHALNTGVRHASIQGYSWALLLDQDTAVDDAMIEVLSATLASCPFGGRVAVVGSRFTDTHGRPDETRPIATGGELWEEVESVITSGSLISLQAYAAIGPFRDEFFIDYVDTEYCFRARAANYRIIATRRPLMSHTVGAPTLHKTLRSSRWTTNHSPDRRYYIARNNTVLLREYGTSDGRSWRWLSIVRCFRLCKRIALYERDKLEKIKAVGEGWWDAMHGNMGPRRKRV